MEYTIVIHQAEEGGYWAEVPALSGCFAQGETVEELLHYARIAITSHIEALKEGGKDIPHEGTLLITKVTIDEAA